MPTEDARAAGRKTQTNAIIIRIRRGEAEEFERLFAEDEVAIWDDFHASGRLLAASLTRVEYGSEEDEANAGDYVPYIIYAVMSGMKAHSAHDDDSRFNAFLKKARKLQPEGPSVWGGRTIFRIGAP